jgi:hypothetical protein
VFGFCYPRRAANDATLAWAGKSLALPRRADGRSWAGRRVTLEERLDGSLWVGADGQHHRLAEAPPVAPVLRARKLDRMDDRRLTPEPSDPPAGGALCCVDGSPAAPPLAAVPCSQTSVTKSLAA